MSLQASKSKIYLFAAGALVVGAVLFFSFGGVRLFSQKDRFVMYFDESVSGVGSRSLVKFKGVPIGYVSQVLLNYHQAPGDHRVPVLVEINGSKIRALGVTGSLADPAVLQTQILRGLRGQLRVVSHVTGVMYVDLNYYPKAPPAPAEEPGLMVIPTVPSDEGKMMKKIQGYLAWLPSYDFGGRAEHIDDFLDSLSAKVERLPFSEYNPRVAKVVAPVAKLDAKHWDEQLDNALAKLDQFQTTITNANAQVSTQSQKLRDGGQSLGQTLDQINATLASLRGDLQSTAELPAEIDHALKPVADMAETLDLKANAEEAQPSVLKPHPLPATNEPAPAGRPPAR